MPLRDVTRAGVEKALREFDRIGRDAMLVKYGGRPSTKTGWYIEHDEKDYGQSLVIRAAHSLQGLGRLPVKRGAPGSFTPSQARKHLGNLGFSVKRWTRSKDLSEPLLNGIKERIKNHTVGFYLVEKLSDPTLLGSGVLVSVGGIHAILTAHHVIQNVEQPLENKALGLLFADRSESRAIDPWAIEFIKIARGTEDSDGPDLGAAIFAPQAPVLGSIKANKTFYNLGKRKERMLDRPPRLRDGIWAAQGYVAGLTNVTPAAGESPAQVRLHAVTAFSSNDTVEHRGQYDYLDYAADPHDIQPTRTRPDSWGGMSGGGLWQIPLNQR